MILQNPFRKETGVFENSVTEPSMAPMRFLYRNRVAPAQSVAPKPSRSRKRQPDPGVTLIEMLVVLSIISIAAGVLILQFAGPATDPRAGAEHLAETLTQAAETALYSGNPAVLVWSADSYRIDTFKPGQGWQSALAAQPLSNGLTLRRDDGHDGPLMIAPGGIALPARFLLTSADAAWRVDFNGLSAQVRTPDADGPLP